jgi:hypothetical protein
MANLAGDNKKICKKNWDRSMHMRGTRIEKEVEIYVYIICILRLALPKGPN